MKSLISGWKVWNTRKWAPFSEQIREMLFKLTSIGSSSKLRIFTCSMEEKYEKALSCFFLLACLAGFYHVIIVLSETYFLYGLITFILDLVFELPSPQIIATTVSLRKAGIACYHAFLHGYVSTLKS